LRGDRSGAPHERLFWRSGALRAVREGNWKLVRTGDAAPELYDLAADVAESRDLAAAQPAVAARLAATLAAWDKELVPPAFAGLQARQGKNKKATKKEP